MQSALSELVETTDRFQSRISHLSGQALTDPVRDVDERAAITLLITGAIERFIREVVESYVQVLCSQNIPFDELPDAVRRHHFEGGAKHLIKIAKQDRSTAQNPANVSFADTKSVADRLASVSDGSYELVWEAFAETNANPGPDTIKSIMHRLGVSNAWPKIEESITFNPFPPLTTNGQLANKLTSELRELINARNRCAHGLAHTATPPYSALQDFLSSVDAIATGMVTVLEASSAAYSGD